MSNSSNDAPEREISIACHVHSDWSYDGKWPLAKLAREFKRRGYRAAMMTEHDRSFTEAKWLDYQEACRRVSSDEFFLLPGIEYSDPRNIIHVLVWGCNRFLGENVETSKLLASIEQGAIAVLAHPSRRDAWRYFDQSWREHLHGIELWNRKTDGWSPSRHATHLLAGVDLLSFAGLDFHNHRQFFPLSMRTPIRSDLTMESILSGIRSKRARPFAFGRPLSQVASSPVARALTVAENVRRPLARAARRYLSRVTL